MKRTFDTMQAINVMAANTLPSGIPGEAAAMAGMDGHVNVLASHMHKQLKEHEAARVRTNRVFEELLQDMSQLSSRFEQAFAARNIDQWRVFSEIDADRSVGILNILWHTLSFTVRGNTRPLALERTGREPLFTGRIIALHGNFRESAAHASYPEMLSHELASLYVPGDPSAPAVIRVRHLGREEQYCHQADAARTFLMKTVEVVCGGGFFHEMI